MYKIMLSKGHIPESKFNERVFAKDTDYSGNKAERNAAITNKMQQHAKITSHKIQRNLRQ